MLHQSPRPIDWIPSAGLNSTASYKGSRNWSRDWPLKGPGRRPESYRNKHERSRELSHHLRHCPARKLPTLLASMFTMTVQAHPELGVGTALRSSHWEALADKSLSAGHRLVNTTTTKATCLLSE